jgi:predicted nucleotidyltransferase
MSNPSDILNQIKSQVKAVIPDAKIGLFGSRANGYATEESDWDILILTMDKFSTAEKRMIQDRVFPISLQYASFINLTLVREDEWKASAWYYSLKKNIGNNLILV